MTRAPRALVRPVSPTLAHCTLTYLDRVPIDLDRARDQHAAYIATLRALGVAITPLPPLDAIPDAVFVEDAAVVLPHTAVVARLARPSADAETESVAAALATTHSVTHIVPPGTLEGGDVLRAGATLFVGQSRRTNAEGIRQLSAIAAASGMTTIPVDVRGCLHLKTACSILPDGALLINPQWTDTDAFGDMERLPVPDAEPWGANTLTVGDTVVMPNVFPETRTLLEARGYDIRAVQIAEFGKAEAGVTCLSAIA